MRIKSHCIARAMYTQIHTVISLTRDVTDTSMDPNNKSGAAECRSRWDIADLRMCLADFGVEEARDQDSRSTDPERLQT